MEKHILSKSTFIRGTQCLKSLYLNKKRPFLRDRLSDAQRAVFKRGTDVGVLAQQLFPGGIDVKPRSPAQYRKKATETQEIIRTNTHTVLYEATFQHDRLLVLLDILVKNSKGWTAYEVKSSLKISETYLLDAAFQYYVITRSGVPLEDFFLVTLNPDYCLGDRLDVQQLFTRNSVLEEVKRLQPFIEEQIEKEKEALLATSSPQIPIGTRCHHPYPCDFLGHCWKKVADNSLLFLDAFDEIERFEKYYAGEDAPERYPQTGLAPLQQVQLSSAIQKKLVVHEEKLNEFVHKHLQSPVFVSLFFIRPAVPFTKGTRPYQLLPVAACFNNPNTNRMETAFFADKPQPTEAFSLFLKKLSDFRNKIVVYETDNLKEYFEEIIKNESVKAIWNNITGLKPLFSEGTLFHYLFHGDYSPQKAAGILLQQANPRLNPALLGMTWQQTLFERTDAAEKLKLETEKFLVRMNRFQQDLVNFLKYKTKNIYQQPG